jgi:DTW domain-containing protein YfiP
MNPKFTPSCTSVSALQRATCYRCRRPQIACYCAQVQAFDPGFDLVLLVHPREAKNPVGTARMLYRFTRQSLVFEGTGQGLGRDPLFQAWLEENRARSWVLYPGDGATILTPKSGPQWAQTQCSKTRRPAILLIDGTWSQARGLIRDCPALHELPQLAFQPRHPSRYQIREQPGEQCLSSLEAVVELCDLIQRHASPGPAPMLATFEQMVKFQVESELQKQARSSVE